MFEFDDDDLKKLKLPRNDRLPTCRINAAELLTFKQKVMQSGLSASDYMRRACIDGHVTVRNNAIDVEAVKQLKYIGNNLNQLTRSAHIHGDAEPHDLKQVLSELNRVLMGII